MHRGFHSVFTAVLTSVIVAIPSSSINAQTPQHSSPTELLNAWVELWGSYDLDQVSDLFIQDDRLTYFSSEVEGLIVGFDDIVEHHKNFGFTAGGSNRDQLIWVGDVEIVDYGDAALVAAIWYFGTPDVPEDAQRGPMSLLAVRGAAGYRIAHMHFATYGVGQP